jgi:hypothetical protein
MLGGKRFKFTDDQSGASARDFGFCAGGMDQHIVFRQPGGERLDESEVA